MRHSQHIAIDLRRVLEGFIANANSSMGTVGYLDRVNAPTYMAKAATYSIQTLVGDAFAVRSFFIS